jgi:lipopolysaccharide/colanic/teichoic acid biosynthesis glycosyltransferase
MGAEVFGLKKHNIYKLYLKGMADKILAVILLILLFPIFLIITLLIYLDDYGPIIYYGERMGQNGNSFYIYKFRTMIEYADKESGTTAVNDKRITKIGRTLRKLKLDELPQLINILRGEMSLVGPRPELIKFTSLYSDEDFVKILSIKPGLTDYSSIKYRSLDLFVGDVDADKNYLKKVFKEKNKLRKEYVDKMCLYVDIKLIFKTIIAVLFKWK